MSFSFQKLDIPEVILIKPELFVDNRGFFMETFKNSVFEKFGIDKFVQENYSFSMKNVLRGLHYQKSPNEQAKLVGCVKGKIFDVAVDIRDNSPTKYSWVSVILSDENKDQLYIPKGFAHGFCVISEEAEVIYRCTSEYDKERESGILWNDNKLKINWPISNPILSEKDKKYPLL